MNGETRTVRVGTLDYMTFVTLGILVVLSLQRVAVALEQIAAALR